MFRDPSKGAFNSSLYTHRETFPLRALSLLVLSGQKAYFITDSYEWILNSFIQLSGMFCIPLEENSPGGWKAAEERG